MTADEDLAAEMLRQDRPEPRPQRRMSDWTPEVELLSVVVDRLAELSQTVAASRGAKPRQIAPAPRPVTATDRVRERQRLVKHRSIVARVLPHKAAQYQPDSSGGERPPS